MCDLCLALCCNLDREKAPRLLVVLHLPWAGSFSKLFSLFIPAQILRWPRLVISREKKEGVRGRRSPVGTVLSRPSRQARPPRTLCQAGQPGALLALPKAGKLSNPYCDTVQNGFALGKSGTHDPQLDAKALLPTHTFPPCWNLRKSPKRPALPGAVNPGRCRSLAPTLSPAVFSRLSPLLGFGGYVMSVGGTS